MAETTEFELVSPERLLLSRPVTMVIMPGSEGYFGAQPGHAPFIATLRPGVIDVYEGDRIADRIFVAGGVAEVTEARCTVLAEDAVAVADLDRAKVEQQVRDLTEEGPHIERELALVKVAGMGDKRIEALRIADIFKAVVLDATLSSFVFELTGTSDDLDRFIELMRQLGLVELSRTGAVAMSRGSEGL